MTPEQFDVRFQALIDTLETLAEEAEDLSAQIGEREFLDAKILRQTLVLQRLIEALADRRTWEG